ncbi:MAG: hypothetical protein EZS28_044596 [Streblomastix strix]|uniref:Uncharacterized protein n=1 Tax=Streblomastix strix TaxID=222440 RepID=A0A5J4TNU6_9EUKA|nr:MAG: hypothetical protein EZS28_044596 [Streblomastix strix]
MASVMLASSAKMYFKSGSSQISIPDTILVTMPESEASQLIATSEDQESTTVRYCFDSVKIAVVNLKIIWSLLKMNAQMVNAVFMGLVVTGAAVGTVVAALKLSIRVTSAGCPLNLGIRWIIKAIPVTFDVECVWKLELDAEFDFWFEMEWE